MTTNPTRPAETVVVPAPVLEAIAHNLCSLHDFDPAFVASQERFALAVVTEYLRAAPQSATREEAPAEAGEDAERIVRRWASWIIDASSDMDHDNHDAGRRMVRNERDLILSALRARSSEPVTWRDGAPPHPWSGEWFIAETTYGDRVVLRALPEEYNYDFRTADETYIKAALIKRWMRFPDAGFKEPDTHPSPDALRVAREALMGAGDVLELAAGQIEGAAHALAEVRKAVTALSASEAEG